MKGCERFLTDDEKNRNIHGPMIQYDCLIEKGDDECNKPPVYTVTPVWRKDVNCDTFFCC